MNPCAYFTLTLSCHILIHLKSFLSSEMHGGSLGEDITGGQIKEKWGGGVANGRRENNFWEVNAAALDVIFDDKNPGVW